MREFYVLLNFILAIIMLNMNIKKIKVNFAFGAMRPVLRIFDIDF